MKSVLRTTAYVLTLLLIAVSACGCLLSGSTDTGGTRPSHGQMINSGELSQSILRRPLSIIPKTLMRGECRVKYPYVCDSGMDLLNISLHSTLMEFASDCGEVAGTVDFVCEFNNYGLLSFTLNFMSADGSDTESRTVNFNCDTGEPVCLSDCFGAGVDYAPRLGEIVSASMEENGYTAIGMGPRFDDSAQFLFTYGGIFLVYREYEAFSFDAGAPRIKVRLSGVSDILTQDALLNRIK